MRWSVVGHGVWCGSRSRPSIFYEPTLFYIQEMRYFRRRTCQSLNSQVRLLYAHCPAENQVYEILKKREIPIILVSPNTYFLHEEELKAVYGLIHKKTIRRLAMFPLNLKM